MKAYKAVWKTFESNHAFGMGSVLSGGYGVRTYDKFFASKEAGEEFVKKKNEAARELGLFSYLDARLEEVDLE